MPFLRPVAAVASQAPVEIRSSKTLIGSGQSKCDVVLPVERGVLDLHALLNLSTDHASATLVPFSATTDGACFLNGRVVPAQGAMVVHGDRVAFGSADNAFVFSLTDASGGPRPAPQHASDLQNSRSFRRTLDALRGDRAPVLGLQSKKQDPAEKPLSRRASRDQLERFLADASTDSLLGDFVERKLRSSGASSSARSRRLQRPTAMEPPPSLSASSVSSLRSSLADSILDRTATSKPVAATEVALGQSQSLLSTAERNYVEIEKLRLSQRLREVNSVLNGHIDFASSYLSAERRSSGGSASMRFSSPLNSSAKPKGERKPSSQRFQEREDEGDDQAEEAEEDDELPAMVEKARPRKTSEEPTAATRLTSAKSQLASSVKASIASLLRKSVGASVSGDRRAADAAGDADDEPDIPLDESLPSFSEAILRQRTSSSAVAVSASAKPAAQSKERSVEEPHIEFPHPTERKVRPQLHQKLIDRTLQRKRHELLSEAFVRWRRGLRIQQQRRRDKSRQNLMLDVKLQILRRNQCFAQWKRYTDHKLQVLQCREEALTLRQQLRSLRASWTQWAISAVNGKSKRIVLGRLLRSLRDGGLRSGLERWRTNTILARTATHHHRQVQQRDREMEARMNAVAGRHHQLRVVNSMLLCVLRAWRVLARNQRRRKHVLRRKLQLTLRRQQLGAWVTWKQATQLRRHASEAEAERRQAVQAAHEQAKQKHDEQHSELAAQHEKETRDLRAQVETLQKQLLAYEKEREDKRKCVADAKASAKTQWSTTLERLLEDAIALADVRIAEVGAELERFLQRMDVEPEAARFQAASFLVEAMLEQKMRHANARVAAQESLLAALETGETVVARDDVTSSSKSAAWTKSLTKNAQFLFEMAQQRQARLHQLHQAIAKLAATTAQPTADGARVDPSRLKHAAFLTDAMHERATDHLDAVLGLHFRRCKLGLAGRQEARKY